MLAAWLLATAVSPMALVHSSPTRPSSTQAAANVRGLDDFANARASFDRSSLLHPMAGNRLSRRIPAKRGKRIGSCSPAESPNLP
jgi:hypothetical protein